MELLPFSQRRLPNATVWEFIERYETALRELPGVDVGAFLPDSSSPYFSEVATELFCITIEHHWNRGTRDILNVLLEKYPWIPKNRGLLAQIAFEDFRQSHVSGHPHAAQDYRERFQIDVSQWQAAITESSVASTWGAPFERLAAKDVDPALNEGDSSSDATRISDTLRVRRGSTRGSVGRHERGSSERWAELEQSRAFDQFRLLGLLGSGAFSRVYLAEQTHLAARPVVLKITSTPLRESERLARLQHAGIVPIYSIHHHQGLYAICMPLLGTATLADLVSPTKRRLSDSQTSEISASTEASPSSDESGLTLDRWREALERSRVHLVELLSDGPVELAKWGQDIIGTIPETAEVVSEIDLVLHLGLQLAEALAHAHRRGVLHRDIKPANILVTHDGRVMLLDFNLATQLHEDAATKRSAMVGTLPYMAPEQLRWSPETTDSLTSATDLHALGVVLYQLLTGRLPRAFGVLESTDPERALAVFDRPIESVRQLNSRVSPATAAIVHRCLAANPAARYASADQLAEDLRRQLEHQPLRYAPDRSVRERMQKWLSRHPRWRSTTFQLGFVAALLLVLIVVAQAWQSERQERRSLAQFSRFQSAARDAEALMFFPAGGTAEVAWQRAGEALAVFDVLDTKHWEDSQEVRALPQEQRTKLFHEMIQLLGLIGHYGQRMGEDPANDVLPQAIATQRFVSRADLQNEERRLWEELSLLGEVTTSYGSDGSSSDRDLLLQANERYLARDYAGALQLLEEQLEIEPDRFALWFLAGKCRYELRQYREADGCFAAAFRVDRQSALALVARASCQYWQQDYSRALELLEQAEQIDPGLAVIHANRALVFERSRQWPEAIAAIDVALELEPQSIRHLSVRSRLRRQNGDSEGAEADLVVIRAQEPTTGEEWILRGLARVGQSAADAIEDFRQASRWPESRAVALQNIAHVRSELMHDRAAAIATLDELLDTFPDFLPAITGRAVLHARNGDRQAALQDVERSLKQSLTPQFHYQLACVHSLLSTDDPAQESLAFQHLSLALAPAYGSSILATDTDLKPLATNPRFRQILSGVEALQEKEAPLGSPKPTASPSR